MIIKEYKDYSEEIVASLYADAGWKAYLDDLDSLKSGYENSLLTLAAYEGTDLLGIIRVVGDGATIIFIQDIIVYKRYQRMGVGAALLKAVLDRYSTVRQIELVTDNTEKTKAFYRSAGFKELSEIGCCGFMRV